MVIFILLTLGVSVLHADSHTLRYYYSVISDKGSGLPEFSVVAYVDDQEVLRYDSDTHLAQPVTQWVEKNERLEYWDRVTETFKAHESVLINDMKTTLIRFNQTTGFHSYQKMYGCELKEDGGIVGFSYYGYDGRDFIYLDTQEWVYTPIIEHAQILTQAWNRMGVRRGEVVKKYMENICIKDLKDFLENGGEVLRKIEPDNGLPVYLIVSAAIGCIAALIIAALVIGVKKMKRGYKITNNSETSSGSSDNAKA